MQPCSDSDLATVYGEILKSVGQGIASIEVAERVRQRRPDNLWSVFVASHNHVVGLYALVMLNQVGLSALLRGEFSATDPDDNHLARVGEKIAAIYQWALYAPGVAAACVPLVAKRLQAPEYRHADLFGVGVTKQGRRLMEAVGFSPIDSSVRPPLYCYRRIANRTGQTSGK